jgi:hypothetical protein
MLQAQLAKQLMDDIMLADGLETLADRIEALLREPPNTHNEKFLRHLKGSPPNLRKAVAHIRGTDGGEE